MPDKEKKLSRRDFIRIASAMGAGSIVASAQKLAAASDTLAQMSVVPTRPFGKTGVNVSMLGLGGSQDLMSKQLLLRQAVKMGVTYWDTAYRYEGGNSEKAIGKYFTRFPEERKKIFLVTKSPSSVPGKMTKYLQTSLNRLKTSYVDLYFVHSVSRVKADIDQDTKVWAERAKASGKIRFFGFSTHSNMARCLVDGAGLGWIDGIMVSYNYRLMQTTAMQRAVDACRKAGIGLTAMKTQAKFLAYFYADIGKENDVALKFKTQFMEKGYTAAQAKLKAVWENPDIASICSEMPNMTVLQANVAAALDKTRLTRNGKQFLEEYARNTAYGYCAGCTGACESAVEGNVPIGDIMRCLMYSYGYGKRDRALREFNRIPLNTRKRLAGFDYAEAERICPQKMPIAKLMQNAVETFKKTKDETT